MGSAPATSPGAAVTGKAGQGTSLLRHPGLAQADKVSGLEQGVDLRNAPISVGLHLDDARKGTFTQQLARLTEFGGGTMGLAFERIGRGKPDVWPRRSW